MLLDHATRPADPTDLTEQRRNIIFCILIVATLLKSAWTSYSTGYIDTPLFANYGKLTAENGLAWMYANQNIVFNHTPFTGILCALIHEIAGGDRFTFGLIFRFITIAADVVAIVGLVQLGRSHCKIPWWSIAALAASPVSMMVSGYHGNVDPIMTAFLVLGVWAAACRQPILCGVWFALSCNIKVVPLMLVPAFFLYWYAIDRKLALRWVAGFAGVMLAGFAIPFIESPEAMPKNVMGYGGLWGSWGVSYWLRETGVEAFQKLSFKDFNPSQEAVMRVLKFAIIGLVLHTSWMRRARTSATDFIETISRCWIILFVFAPSGSPQYMVWFAPFVAITVPRWSIVFLVTSTIYDAVCYGSTANTPFPWEYGQPKGADSVRYSLLYSNVPWLAFLACYVWVVRNDWMTWLQNRKDQKTVIPPETPVAT